MTYDHNLLLSDFVQRLRQAPSKSLGCLSREMGVSRRTLENLLIHGSRKRFKEIQGEILLAVVRRSVLRNRSLTMKELSFSLGYNSPRTFTRQIRRACGMSPVELRASIAEQLVEVLQYEA